MLEVLASFSEELQGDIDAQEINAEDRETLAITLFQEAASMAQLAVKFGSAVSTEDIALGSALLSFSSDPNSGITNGINSSAPPEFDDWGFASGEVAPPDAWSTKLQEIADYARLHPNCRIIIETHTDTVGDAAANLLLAQRRAREIEQLLDLESNSPPSGERGRIILAPWGEDHLFEHAQDGVPNPKNRRARISFAC